MSQEPNESLLIKSLYQSALKADYWSVALSRLCKYCGAQAASLMITDSGLVSFSAYAGVPFSSLQSGEVMIHCIPMLQGAEQSDMPGCYNWFLVKPVRIDTEGWIRTSIVTLGEQASKIANTPHLAWLVLQSNSGIIGSFSWVSSGLVDLLQFHVRMAVLLFGSHNQQYTRSRVELDILNKLNIGVAWITRQGVVTHSNKAFTDLIAANDGLYLRNSTLSTQPYGECSLFAELARSALFDDLGGIRILDRPSGKLGYQLCYMSLGRSMQNVMGQLVYLAFIFDPEKESECLAGFLERGYGLSKAESKLATHICRGVSVEEYAEQENLRVSTLRTQLRSIYKRTGTKGQINLAFLLRGLEFIKTPDKLEKKSRKKYKRKSRTFDLAAFMASVGVPRRDQD